MARTYRLIARRGTDGFYEGPVADAMAEASQNPPVGPNADHVWRPGLMTEDDVDDYYAPEREPARIRYRGLDIWGMGPPSSGGSTVGEALNILEGYRLSAADRDSRVAPAARVVPLRLRRPQRLPRRPALLRRSARGPPVRLLRRRAARADQREPGGARARWRPAIPTTTRTTAAMAATRPPRSRTRTSRPPTSWSPTARARSCPTRSRSSRRAATASSSRAGASC